MISQIEIQIYSISLPEEYREFVNRANPLLYRNTFIGENDVTKQYSLMSNLTEHGLKPFVRDQLFCAKNVRSSKQLGVIMQ